MKVFTVICCKVCEIRQYVKKRDGDGGDEERRYHILDQYLAVRERTLQQMDTPPL